MLVNTSELLTALNTVTTVCEPNGQYPGTTEAATLIPTGKTVTVGCLDGYIALTADVKMIDTLNMHPFTVHGHMLRAAVWELSYDYCENLTILPDTNTVELYNNIRHVVLPLSWFQTGHSVLARLRETQGQLNGHIISSGDLRKAKQTASLFSNERPIVRTIHLYTSSAQLYANDVALPRGQGTPDGDTDINIKHVDKLLRVANKNDSWTVRFTDNRHTVSFCRDNLSAYIMPYMGRRQK